MYYKYKKILLDQIRLNFIVIVQSRLQVQIQWNAVSI